MENLNETVSLMNSKDYKERFKAEYFQLKIRAENLEKLLKNWNNLKFELDCPKSLLQEQLKYMQKYLQILESRAVYENIDLGIEAECNKGDK